MRLSFVRWFLSPHGLFALSNQCITRGSSFVDDFLVDSDSVFVDYFWGHRGCLRCRIQIVDAAKLKKKTFPGKTPIPNLVITWSRNPHAKTPIPGKPSKSGLLGVWHKDNLYLGTSTIGNGDPHPRNIDSRTRSIRITPRRQLFFDKSFSVL